MCCMCCEHCEWGYGVCTLCAVWVGAAPWSVCLCVGHRLCGEDIDCGVSEGCSPRHTACRMRKEANPLLRSTLHADCKKAPSRQHKLQHAHTDQPLLDITQSTHRNTHTYHKTYSLHMAHKQRGTPLSHAAPGMETAKKHRAQSAEHSPQQ